MFKRLLVPLDGSSLAEAVLPLTRYLAERFQSTIILFHVVEKAPPGAVHGEHHLQQVAEARDYLSRVAAQLSREGVTIVQNIHETQDAGVAQTIRDHADELHADLVVLCAHGRGGLRDVLFGSIAQQVIHQGRVPVLFIRPSLLKDTGVTEIKRILLPLDGLKAHEVAIPVATMLARQCDAEISLLSVTPTAETLPIRDAVASRVSPRTAMLALDLSARQAADYLQQICDRLQADGLAVSGAVLRGDAASIMKETVAAENVDMIVMATHGRDTSDARWEGSLTPRFLPMTSVPVILVRSTPESHE
ncbi:MAG: universal stress protein [Chloroflexi bacterium]|nr:universal stress protein [Chloroflexota bacterium]MCL5275165.1 universal stress protein [Chloroflexota bacterium]